MRQTCFINTFAFVGGAGGGVVSYSGLTLRDRSGVEAPYTPQSQHSLLLDPWPGPVFSLALLVYSFIPWPSICVPTPFFSTLPTYVMAGSLWSLHGEAPRCTHLRSPNDLRLLCRSLLHSALSSGLVMYLSTSFPLAVSHVTKWISCAYLICLFAVTMARLPPTSRTTPLLTLSPMQALLGRTWLVLAITMGAGYLVRVYTCSVQLCASS